LFLFKGLTRVSPDDFLSECDRLSQAVDEVQFERLRWARDEGPVLIKLVTLAQAALEGRSDFELTEEGSTSDIKKYVLKVHSNRVVGITFWVAEGKARIRAEEALRSRYTLAAGDDLAVSYDGLDEGWMTGALRAIFARVS
jgi:hypothetical protein